MCNIKLYHEEKLISLEKLLEAKEEELQKHHMSEKRLLENIEQIKVDHKVQFVALSSKCREQVIAQMRKKHNIFYTVKFFAKWLSVLAQRRAKKFKPKMIKAHKIAITKYDLEIQNKHKLIINITQERDLEENKRKNSELKISKPD